MCDSVKNFKTKHGKGRPLLVETKSNAIYRDMLWDGEVYRYRRKIAEGSYGEVMEYVSDKNNQLAVKLEKAKSYSVPDEYPIYQQLNTRPYESCRENIVDSIYVGTTWRYHYYVMPLLETLDPSSYDDDEQFFQDLVKIEEQILCIYKTKPETSNQNRLIYADLKPSNVLYCKTEDGGRQVFLGDLGSMKRHEQKYAITYPNLGSMKIHEQKYAITYPPPELRQDNSGMVTIDHNSNVYGLFAWQLGCLAASRITDIAPLSYGRYSDDSHNEIILKLYEKTHEHLGWYRVIGLLGKESEERIKYLGNKQPTVDPISCWAVFFIPKDRHSREFKVTDTKNHNELCESIYNEVIMIKSKKTEFIKNNLVTYVNYEGKILQQCPSFLIWHCLRNHEEEHICDGVIRSFIYSYNSNPPDVGVLLQKFVESLHFYLYRSTLPAPS